MNDNELLHEMMERTVRSSPFYYMPFNEEHSRILREIHKRNLHNVPPHGALYSKHNSLLAKDYTRIVIGDYGAFIEFTQEQANLPFERWFHQPPTRFMKYDWLYPKGERDVKVYYQLKTVAYADYQVGCYYVSPEDIKHV